MPFIRSADEDAAVKHTGRGVLCAGGLRTSLVEHYKPDKLVKLMNFDLPGNAKGKDGLLSTVEQVLKYSVNTWDQGFLDKLYASTNAVGVISELLLAVLNTNVSGSQDFVNPSTDPSRSTFSKSLQLCRSSRRQPRKHSPISLVSMVIMLVAYPPREEVPLTQHQ